MQISWNWKFSTIIYKWINLFKNKIYLSSRIYIGAIRIYDVIKLHIIFEGHELLTWV